MPTYALRGKRTALSPTYVLIYLALQRLSNWKLSNSPNQTCDYSNINSRLSTFAQTKHKITGKVFIAKLLKNTNFIPKTWIIRPGTKPEFHDLGTKSVSGKFFLKPDNNFGGKGIKILSKAVDYKHHINKSDSYVLQQSVPNIVLYNGRKFDLRIYVYLVYRSKSQIQMFPDLGALPIPSDNSCRKVSEELLDLGTSGPIQVYTHPHGGYLRIAKQPYEPGSLDPDNNLTNNSWQDKLAHTGEYVNQPWHEQDFYEATYPQIQNAIKETFRRLRPYWKTPSRSGIELMGFDFLLSQESDSTAPRAWLLELNRHLGYPIVDKLEYNPRVRELVINITKELIVDFMEPLLEHRPYNPDTRFNKLLTL